MLVNLEWPYWGLSSAKKYVKDKGCLVSQMRYTLKLGVLIHLRLLRGTALF